MTTADWRVRLRAARKRLGVSQARLAELAGLSLETVRGYENGRRRPKREHLIAVLTALRVEHSEQHEILSAAGFAPEPRVSVEMMERIWHTRESAIAECERHTWPAFVVNEFADVVGANTVARRLWGVDLEDIDPSTTVPMARNLLSVASDPRFVDHVVNWEEAMTAVLAVFKAHDWAPEDIEQPGPYLKAVLERFLAGNQRYVNRLIELWQQTPSTWERKEHWSYPIVWCGPNRVEMHFEAIVTSASLMEGLTINDWIPLDAQTWQALALA